MVYDWDLHPISAILEQSGKPEWQTLIDKDVLSLQTTVRSDDLKSTFNNILRIDNKLGAVWNAKELVALNSELCSLSDKTENWLKSISEQFSRTIYTYMLHLGCTTRQIDNNIQAWAESLPRTDTNSEIGTQYEKLLQKWNNQELTFAEAIILRNKIDPELKLLDSRALGNCMATKDLTPDRSYSIQSQQYFNEILKDFNNKPTSIQRVRQHEANLFSQYCFSITEAISLINSSLETIGSSYQIIFNDLLNSNRLKILQDQSRPDLCFDSPLGSYVQVYFNGSLLTLNKLVHEVGHAIHQSIHRKSSIYYVPLTDVQSETWALCFENYFMRWLSITAPKMNPTICRFTRFQKIEMNYRHQMLTNFELDICRNNISSESDINALWTMSNRSFYGSNVLFNDEFKKAWMGIHHLLNAPFYLSTYSIAKERSDSKNFIDLVSEYKN